MKRIVKVGSRESSLAMVQTRWVIEQIRAVHPEILFEIVPVKTKGDIILDTRLDKIGGKGLFIKELENGLLEGSIDIAVHSMKDMPAEIPGGLVIAAVSKREDPRDVLVAVECKSLEELKNGAIVGTSSVRRELQLLQRRPDLNIATLRGNVLTRLNKLVGGEFDAIVLAAAGLKRLGLEEKCVQYFEPEIMIPAVGQGVLAIEARSNFDTGFLMDSIHNQESQAAVSAERAYMIKLNGGCTTPIAAHAIIDAERMQVYGMLAGEDKSRVYKASIDGSIRDAAKLGEELADRIIEKMRNDGT